VHRDKKAASDASENEKDDEQKAWAAHDEG
jgi:hypothetical protein